MKTAVEILTSKLPSGFQGSNPSIEWEKALQAMEEYACQVSSGKWIPIKDKLPELNKNVLLLEQCKHPLVGRLRKIITSKDNDGETQTYQWTSAEFPSNITHWMMLHALPENK
jgi:YD repeat-containing protein